MHLCSIYTGPEVAEHVPEGKHWGILQMT